MTDGEIVDAIGLLARTEGIFAETAGGVTIADGVEPQITLWGQAIRNLYP